MIKGKFFQKEISNSFEQVM